MARYYLHLRDFEGAVIEDEEGSELPSLSAARKEAMFAMQDFVAAAIRQGGAPLEAIVVADEHGTRLAAAPPCCAAAQDCGSVDSLGKEHWGGKVARIPAACG